MKQRFHWVDNEFDLSKEMTPMHNSARWQELSEQIQTAADLSEIVARLDHFCEQVDGASKVGDLSYWFDGCEFAVGVRSSANEEISALQKVNELAVGIAPALSGLIEGPDNYVVVVHEYGDGSAGMIEPLSTGSHKLSDETRQQFLEGVEKLLDQDLCHDYAVEGYHHWHYEPGSKRIVLKDWSALREIEENKKEGYLGELRSLVEAL